MFAKAKHQRRTLVAGSILSVVLVLVITELIQPMATVPLPPFGPYLFSIDSLVECTPKPTYVGRCLLQRVVNLKIRAVAQRTNRDAPSTTWPTNGSGAVVCR